VFTQVPVAVVRDGLRQGFATWGLPRQLRLDNGRPWGGWCDLPTALALDLSGLGLSLHHNDPRCPRQNGVVERSHGTSQDWGEPHTCADAAELQTRLDEFDEIHRSEYPHVGSKSRLEVYPELLHSGRAYDDEWERRNWSMERVKQYLAGYVGVRRVSGQGRVSVYDERYQVGRVNAGKQALVQYDPDSESWLFSSEQGVLWCSHPARQITAPRVRALELAADPPE
jgi:hypothetical protein